MAGEIRADGGGQVRGTATFQFDGRRDRIKGNQALADVAPENARGQRLPHRLRHRTRRNQVLRSIPRLRSIAGRRPTALLLSTSAPRRRIVAPSDPRHRAPGGCDLLQTPGRSQRPIRPISRGVRRVQRPMSRFRCKSFALGCYAVSDFVKRKINKRYL